MDSENQSISSNTGKIKSLLELHTSKNGKVSDKWEIYFNAYEKIFQPLRDNSICLFEIGVQNGGSLDVWADFFKNAESIVGCDIAPECANLWYDDPRINVVVGNANDPKTHEEVSAYSPTFDIIIDDGSHISNDIINSFLMYFPDLKPGGIYIVEDTHALYRATAGGGILSKTSAHEFFKICAELINLEHWAHEINPRTLFSTFIHGPLPEWMTQGTIESVEFRASMVVIRKSTSPIKLGRRLVHGDEASVYDGILRYKTKSDLAVP